MRNRYKLIMCNEIIMAEDQQIDISLGTYSCQFSERLWWKYGAWSYCIYSILRGGERLEYCSMMLERERERDALACCFFYRYSPWHLMRASRLPLFDFEGNKISKLDAGRLLFKKSQVLGIIMSEWLLYNLLYNHFNVLVKFSRN